MIRRPPISTRTHPLWPFTRSSDRLFGSIERFFGVLVEHFAGAFPAWLAPEQVRVLPVRSDHQAYAARLVDRLVADGFRASLVEADEPLGARIRKAKLEKLPYILVVGDSDVEAGTVGVNQRGADAPERSEEHTYELQSLMRISYAVFCLKKKTEMNRQENNR